MSWYRAGSVTVAAGSNVVTGVGTDFVSNVSIGEAFIGPDGRSYEIGQIVSATELRLTTVYGSGQGYAIQPTESFVRDLVLQAASLLNTFGAVRDGVGQGNFGSGSVATPGIRFTVDQDTGIARTGDNEMSLIAGGVVRAKVTPNGLAVPRFSGQIVSLVDDITLGGLYRDIDVSAVGAAGVYFGIGARIGATVTDAAQIYAQLDSASAGQMGVRVRRGSDLVEVYRFETGGAFRPASDNAQSAGTAAYRFSVVYAGTGSINTSDRRAKQQIGDVPDEWLDAWADVEWVRYKFDEAVATKGADARWHIGLIAQQVRDAFATHGLDAMALGLLCHDQWEAAPASPDELPQEAGERWGLRYDECQAIEAAYQRRRIAQLEAKVAALSAQHG